MVMSVVVLHPPRPSPEHHGVGACWMVMVISPSHRPAGCYQVSIPAEWHAKRLRSRRRAHAGPGKRPRAATLTRRASQAWLACLHACMLASSTSRPAGPRCHRNILNWASVRHLLEGCAVACIPTEIASQTPSPCPRGRSKLRDNSSLRGAACSEAVLLKLRTHPGAHLGGGFTAGGFRCLVQVVGSKRLQSSTQLRCSFATAH
jgi:hypothetical protein